MRAVLFDLGNTLVSYYAAPEFDPVLRKSLRGCLQILGDVVFVGYRKPHCAPFERALSLLGVRAGEAVFVGDDPRWDVLGAKQAGIQPILLARAALAVTVDGVPLAASLAEVRTQILSIGST